MDTADTRFFNGDYLKDMFDQCTKRALARPDLSPDRKTNAREDADDFMAFFNAAKQWQVPKLAAHAFEMTMLGIFAGLRAGLSPRRSGGASREIHVRVPKEGWRKKCGESTRQVVARIFEKFRPAYA